MFLQIASAFPAQAGHSLQADDVPSQAECERLLAFTGHDRSRVAAEMLRRLQEPPFTNQLNHADQVLRLMMKADNSDENPNQTAAQYQWAIARMPDDRILRRKFGLFLFEYNPASALRQLQMGQPWDGFPVVTSDGRPIQ